MLATVLMTASAAIFLVLGTLHLVYTFYGTKLTPRDPALQLRMTEVHPVITQQTTMWKTWVGFNASHSLGAMLYGLIYGYLAIVHAALLFQSMFLLVLGLVWLCSFAVLGKRYWFSIPFNGICISLVCYVAAVIASYIS